jgi:hypothetical protein
MLRQNRRSRGSTSPACGWSRCAATGRSSDAPPCLSPPSCSSTRSGSTLAIPACPPMRRPTASGSATASGQPRPRSLSGRGRRAPAATARAAPPTTRPARPPAAAAGTGAGPDHRRAGAAGSRGGCGLWGSKIGIQPPIGACQYTSQTSARRPTRAWERRARRSLAQPRRYQRIPAVTRPRPASRNLAAGRAGSSSPGRCRLPPPPASAGSTWPCTWRQAHQ